MSSEPILLVCDSIAWRADAFQRALSRVHEALSGADSRLELGYRVRDDLALLVVSGDRLPEANALVTLTGFPGARLLELPFDGPRPTDVAARALASCEVRLVVEDPAAASEELRTRIGLGDDRRAARRIAVQLRLRYRLGERWVEAESRDVASGGLFVATTGPLPEVGANLEGEIFLPGEGMPVWGHLVVARHAEGGFGARLTLPDEANEKFQRAVSRLRAPATIDHRRAAPRAPARLEVRFESGEELARAWTENISLGGLFVRTDRPPARGTVVHLALALPDGAEVSLQAEVVHVHPPTPGRGGAGCGLVFREIPPAVRERLEGYVSSVLARPRARVLLAAASAEPALRKALVASRCEVLDATSSHDAFARLVDELFALDAVICTDALGDGDAGGLLHRVRKVGGELDLVMLVLLARPDEARARALREAGADEVLFPGTSEVQVAKVLSTVEARRRS